MPASGPATWPSDLPAAGSSEFDERVAGWLLDRAPAVARSTVLRQEPLALGLTVRHVVAGEIDGLRRAYSVARTELDGSSQQVALTLQALEGIAADLLRTQREVEAVVGELRRRGQR